MSDCNVLLEYLLGTTMLSLCLLFSADLSDPLPDGQLRLSDHTITSFSITGRLEILLFGRWGTVCSRDFNLVDANIACKQLSYENASQIFN